MRGDAGTAFLGLLAHLFMPLGHGLLLVDGLAQDRILVLDELVENKDTILSEAIDEQEAMAERHEEMRKQAEERRSRIATHREAMSGMNAEERLDYMEAHRDEIFPPAEREQRRAPPRQGWSAPSARYRMPPPRRSPMWQQYSEPPVPPAWMRSEPRAPR